MDGILMNQLHGNLNLLSEMNMKRLLRYFAKGTLSLRDRNLLLKEIINAKGTSKVVHLQN